MPKNNVSNTSDGRKRYRYTDSSGKRIDLRQRRSETVSQFKRRCEQAEEISVYSMTFSELYHKWQKQYQKIYCSRADYLNSEQVFNLHIKDAIGHLKLHEVTRAQVYKILADLSATGRSPSLLSKVRAIISRPYNWAINTLEYDLISPTSGLIMKSNKQDQTEIKGIRIISDDEYDQFFSAAKHSKYFNYFQVLRYTGLRPSEAAGLQIDDDKGDCLSIRRGITEYETSPLKTPTAKREIPITKPLRAVLNDQKSKISKNGPWLFPSVTGEPVMNAIKLSFKRVLSQTAKWEKVGRKHHGKLISPAIDFNLYDFRHTFATNAARELRPSQLQYIMGHSSIEITLKYYVGLSNDDHKEASEKLEKIFSKKMGTKLGTNYQFTEKNKVLFLKRKTP